MSNNRRPGLAIVGLVGIVSMVALLVGPTMSATAATSPASVSSVAARGPSPIPGLSLPGLSPALLAHLRIVLADPREGEVCGALLAFRLQVLAYFNAHPNPFEEFFVLLFIDFQLRIHRCTTPSGDFDDD